MRQLNLRRVALIGGLITVLVVATIWWLVHYFTTGNLLVSTDSDAQITITAATSGKTVAQKNHTNGLGVDLRGGDYIVQVSGAGGGRRALTTIQTRHHQRLELDLTTAGQAIRAAAINSAAFSVAPNGSVDALDASSNQLVRYTDTAQRPTSLLPTIHQITAIQWLSATQAVLIGDGFGYYFDGTTASRFNILFEGNIVIAANPASRQFAIGVNKKIYLFNAGSLTPSRTFQIDSTGYQLAVTNRAVIAYYSPDAIQNGVAGKVFDLTSGQARIINQPISALTVAPTGDKIAYATQGVSRVADSLLASTLLKLPTRSSVLGWEVGNQVLFADGNSVWRYDIAHQAASLLANAPNNGTIVSFNNAATNGAVYFADTVNGATQIYGTLNQPPKNAAGLTQLASVLPYSTNNFAIDYSNLTLSRPTVRITTMGILNNPDQLPAYQQQTQQYRQQALDYLKSKNIAAGQYQIIFIPDTL